MTTIEAVRAEASIPGLSEAEAAAILNPPTLPAPPPTVHIGPELSDRRSHVERLNPGDNPADGTGTGIPH